ncbi:Uma2 family endonuclease [Dyadobacter psychrotolerans]|uniref:Uma2 family endonuclease n=1 Tax=Dyadobacter psychrotolerans TaxID=2541721 RepID=A0A4V2Z366_9BACT|nr:Uma2 family endonuclease [Dyadobacter psychrotolerans]TDE11588.1 Uma2 family endonuclease [Dyadobacter psychrotolerans]
MIASPGPRKVLPKITAKSIPSVLIHEIIDGKPLYRKGYREVLAKTKKIEDIMGSSSLQAFLITYLTIWIGRQIDDDKYFILTNEAGLHIDNGNNLAGDLLIFDNRTLTIDKINKHYADVPPKISIEVDIDIALDEWTEHSYMSLKTKKLLDFGVQKVIWFLTASKKVMIAVPQGDWQLRDWDKDVEILDGIICNVGNYLKEKGSEFA